MIKLVKTCIENGARLDTVIGLLEDFANHWRYSDRDNELIDHLGMTRKQFDFWRDKPVYFADDLVDHVQGAVNNDNMFEEG
jgi:hypothetical protein